MHTGTAARKGSCFPTHPIRTADPRITVYFRVGSAVRTDSPPAQALFAVPLRGLTNALFAMPATDIVASGHTRMIEG